MEYVGECVVECGRSRFAVDSWRAPGCGAYFLTHAHADHLVGLSGARLRCCRRAAVSASSALECLPFCFCFFALSPPKLALRSPLQPSRRARLLRLSASR